MTSEIAKLIDALAVWPLDREQRNLIEKATTAINEIKHMCFEHFFRKRRWR